MVSALDAWLSVAVTVVVPPFSEIELFVNANVAVGAASLFVIVPVPVAVAIGVLDGFGLLIVAFMVSSAS